MESFLSQAPAVVPLIAGLVLAFFGRRLIWLSLGLVGFALGLVSAQYLPPIEGELMRWAIPIGLGLAGMLLAGLVRRLAVRLLGLASGGYLGFVAVGAVDVVPGSIQAWLLVAAGALLGAFLAAWLLDRALELLTAAVGGHLAISSLGFEPELTLALAFGVTVLGFFAQWRQGRGSRA